MRDYQHERRSFKIKRIRYKKIYKLYKIIKSECVMKFGKAQLYVRVA